MDSGDLDTTRKDLQRQQKAEKNFLGEGTHHQQRPHTAPRSSFCCFLLLKRFFAAVLQRIGPVSPEQLLYPVLVNTGVEAVS